MVSSFVLFFLSWGKVANIIFPARSQAYIPAVRPWSACTQVSGLRSRSFCSIFLPLVKVAWHAQGPPPWRFCGTALWTQLPWPLGLLRKTNCIACGLGVEAQVIYNIST